MNQASILEKGVKVWNAWRIVNRKIKIKLIGIKLYARDLRGVNFSGADLQYADFGPLERFYSKLQGANFVGANLTGANFEEASIIDADLTGANLSHANFFNTISNRANFKNTKLSFTRLDGTILKQANFENAFIEWCFFGHSDLSQVLNLDKCRHGGESIIDFKCIKESWPVPKQFLRGCGLPDNYINILPELVNQTATFPSCFISYSSDDEVFAKRLHDDLQNKGVRCWFAPEKMKIGDRIRPTIDQAIKENEKVLLILSKNSIRSQWVEKEVETSFEHERIQNKTILFPLRLDDSIFETDIAWAADLRRTRHIGDFKHWEDNNYYRTVLDKLLSDLQIIIK